MSDTTVSTETPAGTGGTPTTETTTPPAGTEGAEGNSPEGDGDKPDPMKELPDWAQKEITKLRSEAANFRVKAREAETKLSEAKTPEEFEAALVEIKTANAQLERQVLVDKVARKHKLPDELAEALQGATAEELEAHAKKLAKFAPAEESEPEELHGGLKPGGGEGAYDPVAASRKARARRR